MCWPMSEFSAISPFLIGVILLLQWRASSFNLFWSGKCHKKCSSVNLLCRKFYAGKNVIIIQVCNLRRFSLIAIYFTGLDRVLQIQSSVTIGC